MQLNAWIVGDSKLVITKDCIHEAINDLRQRLIVVITFNNSNSS